MDKSILAEEQHIRVKRCRHGLFMYNRNDVYIGRSLDEYGEYSEAENDVFTQILRPGMVALDIGANIGVHTVSMARSVAPQGWVIAFEPQRVVFQMLCGNIALNALENVTAVAAAVGNATGHIEVPRVDYRRQDNFGGLSLQARQHGKESSPGFVAETVPLRRIDDLRLEFCHFIKIDVEGMEQMVIEGAAATLSRCQPLLYVENNRSESSAALVECVDRLGYRSWWHVTALFNSDNYFGKRENLFRSLVSYNIICIPRSSNLVLQGFVEVTAENATAPPAIHVPE